MATLSPSQYCISVYDDFSTPCFDGKHSMIVGGSFMSTGDEASVSSSEFMPLSCIANDNVSSFLSLHFFYALGLRAFSL